MNHFAKIVEGTVSQVIVVSSSDCGGLQFPSSEPVGQTFIASLGIEGTWLQTSETGEYRRCYAGVGCSYDSIIDVFVLSQPYPSWTLDSNKDWQAPTPKPEGDFYWDEESLSWLAIPVG